MTPDATLERMGRAVAEHLPRADALFVAHVCLRDPERMAVMLSSRAGVEFTGAAFAAFGLDCAKRIAAGPPA